MVTGRAPWLVTGYSSLVRPVLFRMHGGDPERVHETMISTLGRLPRPVLSGIRAVGGAPSTPVDVAGISFPGRVGVAAGLDKDGVAARAWAGFGFGFAELGTVTALPQPGNDRPRVFRLRQSRAIINRMGFNNHGAKALADRLRRWGVRRGEATLGIPLGISLGKSKLVPLSNAVDDYVTSLRLLGPFADYIAVNVSSPNTPGLRTLQDGGLLAELLAALVDEAGRFGSAGAPPIFVKIAPDLTDPQLDEVVSVVTDAGAAGIIATNTTLDRHGLVNSDRRFASEAGGLSGAPLTRRSLEVVRRVTDATPLPVIGCGGIMTADDAQAMFDAGASLVQVYTGFIYAGLGLVTGINALKGSRP